MENLNKKDIVKYFHKGRTLCEISRYFGISVEDASNLVKSFKEDENFDVFPTINGDGKRIFIIRQKQLIVPAEKKVWSHIVASDERGDPQPYIIILMPDDVPWEKIKIYILGDLHYGSNSFDEDAFDAFVNLVLEKEYAFLIGIGDLIENALGESVGGAVYEQFLSPTKQIYGVRELIRPIANKILCIIPGNHEWRSFKVANLDPLEFGVCEHLGIPYFSEPVRIDILWHGKVFTFFAQHGGSNSQTKGGKLNAASRPLSANEHTMFTATGHVHDPMSGKNIKRCREYIRDAEGNIINMRIVRKTEHVVICPAFLKPLTNYGARAGYNPVSQGFVQACVIQPDGRYFVDKKPLIIPNDEE